MFEFGLVMLAVFLLLTAANMATGGNTSSALSSVGKSLMGCGCLMILLGGIATFVLIVALGAAGG